MAYFNQEMKSEVVRRLEGMKNMKFSVRVKDFRKVEVSLVSADKDFIEKLVSFYQSCDEVEAEFIKQNRIYDFSYIGEKWVKKIKDFDQELGSVIEEMKSIVKLQGHPKFEHYAHYDAMNDGSDVAYYFTVSIGDKVKNKPFKAKLPKTKTKE